MKRILIKREWKFACSMVPYWIITKVSKAEFAQSNGYYKTWNGQQVFHVNAWGLDQLGKRIKNGKTVELLIDDSQKSIFVCSGSGMLSDELSIENLKDDPSPITITTKGGFFLRPYPLFK